MGQMTSTDTIRELLRRSGLSSDKIETFLSWVSANGLIGSVINASTPAAELVAMASSPTVQALGAASVRMSAPSAWGDSGELARQAEKGTCGCEPYKRCPDHARRYNEAMGY